MNGLQKLLEDDAKRTVLTRRQRAAVKLAAAALAKQAGLDALVAVVKDELAYGNPAHPARMREALAKIEGAAQ